MLAVMEASQNAAGPSNTNDSNNTPTTPMEPTKVKEFLATGRTGRRNALPDILMDKNMTEIEPEKRNEKVKILRELHESKKINEESITESQESLSDSEEHLEKTESVEGAREDEIDSKGKIEENTGEDCNSSTQTKTKKTEEKCQHAMVTSSDLSTRLQGLTTSDKPSSSEDQPGSSKS